MHKQEFLNALRERLSGLPESDLAERLSFYGEMIDDRIEEGLPEEEAVAQTGTVDEIARQILTETPLSRIVREKIKPKRSLRAWEIVLIVLGFPLWFPLLVAAVAVVISLYAVLWSLLIALWAVEIAFIVSAVALLCGAIMLFVSGHGLAGLLALGAALIFAALSIFLFFACVAASKGTVLLAKKIVVGIKNLFVGKERTK